MKSTDLEELDNDEDDGRNCIFKFTPVDGKIISYKTLCGSGYLPFILDLEHAENCIEQGTRVYPCPDCLEIARAKSAPNRKEQDDE